MSNYVLTKNQIINIVKETRDQLQEDLRNKDYIEDEDENPSWNRGFEIGRDSSLNNLIGILADAGSKNMNYDQIIEYIKSMEWLN